MITDSQKEKGWTEKEGFFFVVVRDEDGDVRRLEPKVKRIVTIALVAFIALITIPQTCTTIHPNEVGVVKTMGKISHTLERGSGLNFKAPFVQKVTKLDMSPVTYETTVEWNGKDAALTLDKQSIGYTIAIVYRFRDDAIIDYVTNFTESSLKRQFNSNAATCLKANIGQYKIDELTSNQLSIADQTKATLISKCSNIPIDIVSVNVSNWDWSPEFDKMIQDTMNATQKEKTAKAQVEIEKANAQVEVAKAQAHLEAERANAEAEVVKAQGEAEAMKVKNAAIRADKDIQTLTWKHEEEMLRLQKWNGKEPGSDANVITPNYSGYRLDK